MQHKKRLPLYVSMCVFVLVLTAGLPCSSAEGFHAVKGALYINDEPAPAGIRLHLVFPMENLTRDTITWDQGYNYGFSFQGHEGETGSFFVYLEGQYIVPVDNQTVTIEQDVIKYRINLTVTTDVPINQPPYTPTAPSPADGQTNVFINEHLSWTGGDPDNDTVTYDIYYGTTNPPSKVSANVTQTSYDPGLFNYSTVYFWKIIAWDNHYASTAGPVWSFSTVPVGTNSPPNQPANPNPADGAINVGVQPTLTWTGGDPDVGDNVTYDVYFGITTTPGKLVSNQSTTTHTVATLVYNSQYYWMIVAWDDHGHTKAGPLWHFTTEVEGSPGGGGGGGGGNTPPVADLSAGEPYFGIIGESILFDGSLSTDADGTIEEWYWTFGDGSTGTGEVTTHAYATTGSFTISLTVTDNQGATDTDTTTASITIPNNPPSTPLVIGPTSGHKNMMYNYTAVSTDADDDTIQYIFNWGDGSNQTITEFLPNGTATTQSHAWDSPGVYVVSVVTNDSKTFSGPSLLSVFIDVEYVGVLGYLIDHDGDGIYDAFYSNATHNQTAVEYQADGTYLIDTDGDGVWDYIYDPVTKQLTAYGEQPGAEEDTGMSLWILAGLLGGIIILLLALLVLLRKKTPPASSPPPANNPPPAAPVKSSQNSSSKKPRKSTKK